ncbi:MAG: FecR domain-containing protein [Casimicrobiaceae bacterium]
MTSRSARPRVALAFALALAVASAAHAIDIGQIKVSKGDVAIERSGQTVPGAVGARLQTSDVIKTGADGSVGITMSDNSLLSAGPNSILSLDKFAFDTTTNQGQFESSLRKGSLSVVSGRIAKQSPDAMTVRTPTAILGVRGTEFAVSVDQ